MCSLRDYETQSVASFYKRCRVSRVARITIFRFDFSIGRGAKEGFDEFFNDGVDDPAIGGHTEITIRRSDGRKRSNRARRWNQVMHERMREERKRRDRCTFGDIFRDGDTELAA